MLCPFWDDLVMGGGGVYSYEDVANHTFIIEYHNVSHVVGGTEHFEVILYDPDYYPTATGDGEIVFQYQTVTIVEGAGDDNDFFTTGIENNEHTDGLQYAYWLVYTPGAPTLTSGKAIKFTTNEPVKVEYSNQVEITMTPSTQPIVIPPNGGSFSYTVAFENLATTPTVFDFWVNLTMPGGSNYGPVFMRQNIELGGSATLQRQLTEYIPGRAPAGNYTYNGLVGDYQTSTVWDQDSFPFTKSGVDAGGIGEWLVTGWEDNLPDALEVPENYILASPAPNPFNPATEIAYALPFSGKITLTVYNSVGQQVRVLVDGWNEAGWHSVEFDGKDLSSGLYFYTLKAGDFTQTQKMLLIK
jgi:hypothetical protein